MRKKLLTIALLLFSISVFAQTTRLEKAKAAIRNYMKENLDDYASYSPVSYGKVDSLFTHPLDVKYIKEQMERTILARKKAGLQDMALHVDISYEIATLKKNPGDCKPGLIQTWEIYNSERAVLVAYLQAFVPKFVGWKVVHKFRTKNRFNATILCEKEFQLNKELNVVSAMLDVGV